MIKSVKFSNENITRKYANNIFHIGQSIDFKPGVNIIIGPNGSGKSTLLNLISDYCLCRDNYVSTFSENSVLSLSHLFDLDNKLKDGFDIKSDFTGVVYNYSNLRDDAHKNGLNSFENFVSLYENNNTSSGEFTKSALYRLFEIAFNNKDVNFPIEKMMSFVKSGKGNDTWTERVNFLIKYYFNNKIDIKREEFEYTFLLDEIDRNLDLEGIKSLYGILSFKKEYTQILAVIHNFALIKKLHDSGNVNFIEMKEGYLEDILKFVKD